MTDEYFSAKDISHTWSLWSFQTLPMMGLKCYAIACPLGFLSEGLSGGGGGEVLVKSTTVVLTSKRH